LFGKPLFGVINRFSMQISIRNWRWKIPELAGFAVVAGIFLTAVTWNRDHVLIPRADGGRLVVLADGDCHARMQRAAMVMANPGTIIKSHDFENYPHGTVPHTTAPMDYLIAGMAGATGSLDLAAAWVSPLLGLFTVLFLGWWSWRLDLRPRWPLLLLFCISPALTHAFALGRPDHQSLLVALTTVALSANMALVRTGASRWAWTSGTAWGLSLWVSWYEPLVLLLSQEFARAVVLRRAAWPPAWRRGLALAGGIAVAAWAVEGFRNPWPDNEVREFFDRWALLLGELQGADPRTMFAWTGWLLVPAPLLLIWDFYRRRDPLALIVLILLAIVTGLTGWQARWNPWLALIFCLALPWILRPLCKIWIVWTVFLLSLWPLASAWDSRLLPNQNEKTQRREKITEEALLEEAAAFLGQQPRGGVIAPWWISPALARFSGQPMVGGTSHQSLPGIVDTARYFLGENDETALRILRKRQVHYVVTDAPERVVPTSAALLGIITPEKPLIVRLAGGKDVPPNLEAAFANAYFRIYKVRNE
jgi:hypothetical protein